MTDQTGAKPKSRYKRGKPGFTEADLARAYDRLDKIAQEINQTEEQASRYSERTVEYRLHIGKLLDDAKGQKYPNGEPVLPHGCFTDWACKKQGWGERYVQQHLQIHRLSVKNRTTCAVLQKEAKGYSLPAIIAALQKKSYGKDRPKRWWVLRGRVPLAVWSGEGEPPVAALVAACTDWRVRSG
ncbi:MAG: hypothetical protein FJ290_28875 [Planctomycetes bacterium]|nr:hypothetical protein [Planctomycetota bacterium]